MDALADRTQNSQRTDRWQGRPIQAGLLRIIAVAIPVAAGVLASMVFSRLISYPHEIVPMLTWWIGVLAVSTLVVAVVERQCRRLLPLATLLKLSMVFPDKAPSRFGVAWRGGTGTNREGGFGGWGARGADEEPSRAAAQILELVGALS